MCYTCNIDVKKAGFVWFQRLSSAWGAIANPENRLAAPNKFGGYSPQSDQLLERYDHEMDHSRKS
jgi:hypothetical protein